MVGEGGIEPHTQERRGKHGQRVWVSNDSYKRHHKGEEGKEGTERGRSIAHRRKARSELERVRVSNSNHTHTRRSGASGASGVCVTELHFKDAKNEWRECECEQSETHTHGGEEGMQRECDQ